MKTGFIQIRCHWLTIFVAPCLCVPQVDNALSQLYQVWLAVAAVLTVQFARTIAMALSISNFLKRPCDRFLTPLVKLVVPPDYAKWIPVVMSW
jgi:hypothetical protein